MSEHDEQPKQPQRPENDERWARDLLGRVALAAVIEQRRSRRWSIFFKSLLFIFLFIVLLSLYFPDDWRGRAVIGTRHTALVKVEGLIASNTDASAENIIAGLQAAFRDGNTAGVILWINSPGGSPVQAGEVYDEIIRLREAYPTVSIYAVAADICASGGYYMAAATERIYANRASIIGSIGVRADSFGFVEALEKLGIERRLYTAGANKSFLDPFLPPDPEDVRHLQAMLNDIHQQFVVAVRRGRGERLQEAPELFTGLVWTGESSLELGLIDGFASTRLVAEEIIGARTVVDYTRRSPLFERVFQGVQSALSQALVRTLIPTDSLR
jgi:protease-4